MPAIFPIGGKNHLKQNKFKTWPKDQFVPEGKKAPRLTSFEDRVKGQAWPQNKMGAKIWWSDSLKTLSNQSLIHNHFAKYEKFTKEKLHNFLKLVAKNQELTKLMEL